MQSAKNVRSIVFAIALGIAFFWLSSWLLLQQQAILLGLIAMMVCLWSNQALPLGVVSLLPIVVFPAFDILPTNEVTPNYAKSIIFLFLGGFLLAIAVEKTTLHKYLSARILQLFPATPAGMIFSLVLTSGLLSSFLSNTTTTLLLVPMALFLTESQPLKMRFVLAIAYGASIGGVITPIGTPPNLILFGLLDDYQIPTIAFLQWVVLVFPLALVMFAVVTMILSLGSKDLVVEHDVCTHKLSGEQKKVLGLLGILIVVLFINAPIQPYYSGLGLNEKGILLASGLVLFMPPFTILQWEDSKKVPYEIMFLFGAGFSIALAFTETGLAKEVAVVIERFVDLPVVWIIILIATLVTFATELTSNTALVSMLLPVILAVCQSNNLDARLFMMVATVCSSYAFMLPIATAPNAIAMSSGIVCIKTMARYGSVLNLLGISLTSLFALLYWRLFI